MGFAHFGTRTNYVGGHNLYAGVDEDEGVRLVQRAMDLKDWRHRSGAFEEDVFESNMDAVDGLKNIAAESDSTPAHLALQWLLSRPVIGSVIAGAKSVAQVNDNVTADKVKISAEQIASVNALTQP